jgi:hypothetical protein
MRVLVCLEPLLLPRNLPHIDSETTQVVNDFMAVNELKVAISLILSALDIIPSARLHLTI